ncbi:chitin synthase [Coprinopsis cinerea AmutBmut pab1-1]|nr:chitin synthase [Coprinopsis cinerea AmutBmut pab1-1]
MAYRPSHNDPYYNQPSYPPATGYGDSSNWDAKSTKSYQSSYAGSQAHLNPSSYEMQQVNQHPVPAMPYNGGYPPQQTMPSPGGFRDNGSVAGWSLARDKLMKRRSIKKVFLTQGNLVLDVPVPSHIVPVGKQDLEEFSKMRYTAATCDPDDFKASRYTLRPYLMGRETELFIVMTMYNEDEVLFVRTMNAVLKNVAHLCSRQKSKTWGPEGWKKVVVCVVSDGRNKVNKRTLQVLNLMGCYQEGIAKDSVAGKDVTAHIFEYTTTAIVTETGEVSQNTCPVQVLFCLKEQNKKKLNSHRWFFNAFGPLLNPNVCILLDVGTKPTGTSIYELWKCFDKHKHVGGACGEITVDSGRGCSLLLTSPLAASQNFEYKMSNILDKPLESVFGYISVLPATLVSSRNMYLAEDRILCFEIVTKKKEAWTLKYVKSAKASTDVPATVPEFISQRRRWLNGSLFASIHATVFFFRIWTSGQGFFRKIALQFEFIYNAVQLLFTWTSLANFYLAFFFLVSSATAEGSTDAFNFLSTGAGKIVFQIFLNLYIGLLFVVLVCSLGNRPQGSKWTYTIAMFLFGLCNIITTWCAAYTVYLAVPHDIEGWRNFPELFKENRTLQEIVVAVLATYGMYFISSFIHFEPWHMFTSFAQYMFLLPSYVNILMMYAMCNLHDVTWGTKGDNGAAKDLGGAKKVKGEDGKEMMEVAVPTAREDVDQLWAASRAALKVKPPEQKESRDAATKQADHDRNSRTNVVLAWVGSNMVLIIVFTSQAFLDWVNQNTSLGGSAFNPYLQFLFFAFAGLSAIRFTGSVVYLIFRLFGH